MFLRARPSEDERNRREFMAQLHARHPAFLRAVAADARLTARCRGERAEFSSTLDAVAQAARLAWVSDAFAAQVLYRAKAAMQARNVPVLPRLAHRAAMMLAQVCIGDPVLVQPGLYLPHGQVVIDGLVEVGAGVRISPWVTVGLRAGSLQGPTIGRDVRIGSGAKLIGDVEVGDGARIGANAVVVTDVAAGVTVVGIPARPAASGSSATTDD